MSITELDQRVAFNDVWRRQKSGAFNLYQNSTARRTITFSLWGKQATVYANANLSIYSAQRCNAACPFCVEELRPASRGVTLQMQKQVESNEDRYFDRLERCLDELRPLCPTLSITGGEPSKDRRLPRILACTSRTPAPRRTLTTNGSGLFDHCGKTRVLDHVANGQLDHLNISVADPDPQTNAALMRLRGGLNPEQLRTVVSTMAHVKTRVRLSCVLLKTSVNSVDRIVGYCDFAASMGIDNVIFRQLMKSDPATHAANSIVSYSDNQRVLLEPILREIGDHSGFEFVKQIVGYYYYVEVWRYQGIDVVFEEADLRHLESVKRRQPELIHELVFHPNGNLASTWQPWDGVLGPPS